MHILSRRCPAVMWCCFLSFFLPRWRFSWWNQFIPAEYVVYFFYGVLGWWWVAMAEKWPLGQSCRCEKVHRTHLQTSQFENNQFQSTTLVSFANLFLNSQSLFNHKQICGDDAIKELIACSCDIMPSIVLHVSLSILLTLFGAELTFV